MPQFYIFIWLFWFLSFCQERVFSLYILLWIIFHELEYLRCMYGVYPPLILHIEGWEGIDNAVFHFIPHYSYCSQKLKLTPNLDLSKGLHV